MHERDGALRADPIQVMTVDPLLAEIDRVEAPGQQRRVGFG
jgi:hypothetical protein